jgi:hypothetical protein
MRWINSLAELVILVFVVVLWMGRARAAAQPAAREGAVAVVELFTSEGCSSCPPADEVLADIEADAQKTNANVFPVAFHVDYWDQLGWKDRFSSAASSERQGQYAKALGSQRYTPQMIVNGRSEFVGSDRDAAHRAIAAALQTAATGRVMLGIAQISGSDLSIEYKTTDTPAGCVLNVVALERAGTTQVPRGENAGRTLKHVNIARAIKAVPLDNPSGHISLKLPADLDAKSVIVVGYLQDPQSMKIFGASKIDAGAIPAVSGR